MKRQLGDLYTPSGFLPSTVELQSFSPVSKPIRLRAIRDPHRWSHLHPLIRSPNPSTQRDIRSSRTSTPEQLPTPFSRPFFLSLSASSGLRGRNGPFTPPSSQRCAGFFGWVGVSGLVVGNRWTPRFGGLEKPRLNTLSVNLGVDQDLKFLKKQFFESTKSWNHGWWIPFLYTIWYKALEKS